MLDALLLQFFENIFSFVQEYQYFVALLTPLLFGELAIYFFGVSLGAGTVLPLTIFISFFSIILYESLVLLLTRYLRRHNFFSVHFLQRVQKMQLIQRINTEFNIYEKRYQFFPLFLLFALKVMPFTKITIFFFALRHPMPLWQFFVKDCIVTFIWAFFIFVPGFLVGKELLADEVGRSLSNVFAFLILSLLIIILFGRYVEPTIQRVLNCLAKRFKRNTRL